MEEHIISKKDHIHTPKKLPLTKSQKVSVGVLSALLIVIPVFVFFAISPLRPIITPASGPITPTVTSNLTPTGVITSTPTPTPPPNNNKPIITTWWLHNARVGRNYRTSIQGYDKDVNDTLEFILKGDADWLKLGDCKSEKRRFYWWRRHNSNVISCELSGVPKQRGNENVTLTLSDGHSEVSKTFRLRVR